LGHLAALIAVGLFVVAGPLPVALAQETDGAVTDDQRAEELFFLGDQLYAQGRYEAAITAFQESYRLSGRPLLLFNIANAQERAGRWEEAVVSLRAWLEHAPEAERPAVQSRIASIEERIRERDASRVEPSPTEPPPPLPVVQPPAPDLAAEPPPPAAPGRSISPLGVALIAGGGAVALLGTGFGIASLRQGASADNGCVTVGGETLCSGEVSGELDKNRAFALAADVTLPVGLAVAAVGLYLVLRSDDEGGPEVAASPRAGGGVLTVAGTF